MWFIIQLILINSNWKPPLMFLLNGKPSVNRQYLSDIIFLLTKIVFIRVTSCSVEPWRFFISELGYKMVQNCMFLYTKKVHKDIFLPSEWFVFLIIDFFQVDFLTLVLEISKGQLFWTRSPNSMLNVFEAPFSTFFVQLLNDLSCPFCSSPNIKSVILSPPGN